MKRFRKRIKVEAVEDEAVDCAEEELEAASSDDVKVEEGAMEQELAVEKESVPASDEAVGEEVSIDAAVILEELEALKIENQENYDKYLRSVAELENFKKRAQKERSELIKYAGESLARELLEVLDSLELALKQKEAEGDEKSEFMRGIEMIHEQFVSVFGRFSIKADSCVGETFDPEKQEAMAVVPSAEYEPGIVIEEFKKTFFFRDKLLRAGQVVVSDALPAEADDGGEDKSAEDDSEQAQQEQ